MEPLITSSAILLLSCLINLLILPVEHKKNIERHIYEDIIDLV